METVKIVYDTKGGDKGAAVVVDGVARALATFEPLTAVHGSRRDPGCPR